MPDSVTLKIKSTGEKVPLAPEVEEIATWWAEVENTDFGVKEKVIKNFEGEILPNIDKKYAIKSVKDLDFSVIKEHLDQVKEEKKNNDELFEESKGLGRSRRKQTGYKQNRNEAA